MPRLTDVALPRDAAPVFPDFCCACDAPQPGSSFDVKARRIHWTELWLPWPGFFGARVTVTVPVCAGCRPQVVAGHWWRAVVLMAWMLLVAAIALPWLDTLGLTRDMKRLVGGIAVMLGSTPVLVWWAMRPPVFGLTVGKATIDYVFASRAYALRFLACNPGARIG